MKNLYSHNITHSSRATAHGFQLQSLIFGAIFFLLASFGLKAQTCFQYLKAHSGFPTNGVSAELSSAACALKTAVTSPYSDNFSVLSSALYLHNGAMAPDYHPAMEEIIQAADAASTYYLLFTVVNDGAGVFNGLKVTLKLPEEGIFECLDSTKLEELTAYIQSIALLKLNELDENNAINEASLNAAELVGVEGLRTELEKLAACCLTGEETDCLGCPNITEAYMLRSYFAEQKGFVCIPLFQVIPYEGNIEVRGTGPVELRTGNSDIDIYTLDEIRFGDGVDHPGIELTSILNNCLNSGILEGFDGNLKVKITNNRTFCTPGRLESFTEEFENVGEFDVSLWLHIWHHPDDPLNQPCLMVSSYVYGEKSNETAELPGQLANAFQIPAAEHKYTNRSEQAASVVVLKSISKCSDFNANEWAGNPYQYDSYLGSELSGAELLCKPATEETSFFVSPAGVPFQLPAGTIVGFFESSNFTFDNRCVGNFVTKGMRWRGCALRTHSGDYFAGYWNFVEDQAPHALLTLADYDGKAWLGYFNPNKIVKADYPYNIGTNYAATGLMPQILSGVILTQEEQLMPINIDPLTLKKIYDSRFNTIISKEFDGIIFKVATLNNGEPGFDYYLFRKYYFEDDEYYKFNCNSLSWDKLPSDPFIATIDSTFADLDGAVFVAIKGALIADVLLTQSPELIHDFLDCVGIIFPPADILNTVIYLAEGEYGMAVLSGVSALPVFEILGDKRILRLFTDGMSGEVHQVKKIPYFKTVPCSGQRASQSQICYDLDFVFDADNFVKNTKDFLLHLPEEKATQFYQDCLADRCALGRFIEQSGNPEGLVKAWEGLFNTGLRTDVPWLTRASKWLDEGASFVADGSGKLTKNGQDILQIKNNKILPDKYDYPVSGGTPVGEASNGYQLVKNGDNLSVRRVPETSGYSQSEVDFLTELPSCHALHRHGPDLTDDALIKRSTSNIAPDGALAPPAGGISSKFSSEQAVKDAIENVKPGTPAFDARVLQPNGLWEVEAPGNFGYGFSSNGTGGPLQMFKVTAVFKEMPDGTFKLFTMYPNR